MTDSRTDHPALMKHIRSRKLPLTATALQSLRGEAARSIKPARVLVIAKEIAFHGWRA